MIVIEPDVELFDATPGAVHVATTLNGPTTPCAFAVVVLGAKAMPGKFDDKFNV